MPPEAETPGARRQRRRGEDRAPDEAPPESVEEALARARDHGRAALAESLAALLALVDAASLAASGRAGESGLAGPLARGLDQVRAWLDPTAAREDVSVLAAISEALDAEIARWEERGRDDPDARAVLRAFLTVREALWELGVRAPAGPGDAEDSAERAGSPRAPRPRSQGSSGRRRVQRIRVEG